MVRSRTATAPVDTARLCMMPLTDSLTCQLMTPPLLAVNDAELEIRRVAVRAATEPSAPTLVLLHEGLGCVAMWKSFPEALAERSDCPVLAYSRAGYGASSTVSLPRPIDFHTREALDTLPALLDAAGIDDCVLVGHSDGASIALIYAGTTGDPRVRGVVGMAPHVLNEPRCAGQVAIAAQAYRDTDLREKLARYHGSNVDCAFRGWSETWLDEGFREWNIAHTLAGIHCPVLAIRGVDDPYNTPVHVETIRRRVSGPVEVHQLTACAHAPHAEQPAATLELIAAWLPSLSARPTPTA